MKILKSGVLYDTAKATKLIEVDAIYESRKLYISHRNNFFFQEGEGLFLKIIPATKDESLEFLTVHQAKIDSEKLHLVLLNYFGIDQKTRNPLAKSVKIAEITFPVESLYFADPKYYILRDQKPVKVSRDEALQWIETHQESLDITKVLNSFVPPIQTA